MPHSKESPDDLHEVEIHEPDFALQKKMGGRGVLGKLFTPERIRAGQKAIEEFKSTYFDDLTTYLEPLHAARDGSLDRNRLLEAVRSLKGHAESLGFDFILHTCQHLLEFASPKEHYSDTDKLVIKKHVEAILASIKNKGGRLEEETLHSLHLLREKLTKH